jgi:ABC-type ATPase involved in cell division
MPSIDLVVSSPLERSVRIKQLEAMFDVPPAEMLRHHWQGDLAIEDRPWNIGLLVGPSGSGKSSILSNVFGDMPRLKWKAAGVIDDFDAKHKMDDIAKICSAVGFNTIPSWMKPYKVLSNGERFRVDLARRLIELNDPIVVDEFTSVVDRQVAKIGAHAVQKYVRRNKRQFVAATCHYDVIEWLQPDWMLEPATMTFTWRSLQGRPDIDCTICRVPFSAWQLFAPFHYLTADLHPMARCFVLFVGAYPAAFAGMLHRPHPRVRDIMGCSRLVTLPDYQGLGLAFVLIDRVAAAFKTRGKRVHTYPAHPALIRGFDKSSHWAMHKRPGRFGLSRRAAPLSTMPESAHIGGRPNAVFEYAGPPLSEEETAALMPPNASGERVTWSKTKALA